MAIGNPKLLVLSNTRKKLLGELENKVSMVKAFPSLKPLYGKLIKEFSDSSVAIAEEIKRHPSIEEGSEHYQFWVEKARKILGEEYAEKA